MGIDVKTPLAMLTLEQLLSVLDQRDISSNSASISNKRYVYGLDGIMSLFHVGRNTAFTLKNTVIKGAVIQHGRKIMVDVDRAIELFEASRSNK